MIVYLKLSGGTAQLQLLKYTSAYYLLLLYAIAFCKPVLPLLKDEVSHFFWNAKHMATVHQHQGGDHAHKEIAMQEEDHKKNDASQISEPVSLHITQENFYELSPLFVKKLSYSLTSSKTNTQALSRNYPPPKMA